MKKLIYFLLISIPVLCFSCGGNNSEKTTNETEDSVKTKEKVDSLATLLHALDSLTNSGDLVHFDIYQIGKIKGIEVSVQKVSVDTTNIAYINLRKDCGGEYYYSWEDAMMFSKELPAFYSATSKIKENLNRSVDHEERYVYVTKDNIALFSSAEPNKSWTTRFSVDSHKSNSSVNLTSSEIDTLLDLIKQAEAKLKEIESIEGRTR